MKKHPHWLRFLCSFLGIFFVSACSPSQPPEPLDVVSNPDLTAHSAEFKQAVIKVVDGVYVAVGFGLANSVLLEGDDGVVIIDAMESAEAARPVKEAFSRITPKPVKGIIYRTLNNYRDAIQFVHDQTIRLMNQGLGPLEIVQRVRLPAHLAHLPYLHEYYGTVPWSVRAIFDGYLGWFGGNATDLFPLPPDERAQRFADLAGGDAKLIEHAKQAVAQEDYQWALELCDQLLRINPESKVARRLKAEALRSLGSRQIAATARNYYLTQAQEVEKKLHIGMMKIKDKDMVHHVTLEGIFDGMAVNLDPEKSADVDLVAGFRFPDAGQAFTVHVRRGVAEIQPHFPDNPDISLTVDSKVWKEVVTGFRNPAVALVKDVDKEGGTLKIIKFLSLFRSDD